MIFIIIYLGRQENKKRLTPRREDSSRRSV